MNSIDRVVDVDFERVWSLVQTTRRNILIHGPGGCGKSHLIKKLRKKCKERGMNIAVTATTGIAALQIGGYTIHSWSGIGIMVDDRKKMLAKIVHGRPDCARAIRDVDLLVVDEISMFGLKTIEMLDYLFKTIRNSNKPFGGIRVLFSGDFLQLPPVKDEWAFKSKAWNDLDLAVLTLNKPKRYTDIDYFNMLLRIRDGTPTPSDISFLVSRVKAYDEKMKEEDSMSEKERMECIKPTILFSKKMDVGTFNKRQLNKLPGEEYVYTAFDSFEPFKNGASMKMYETRLDDSIPKMVVLKVGAQVMLKRNVDIALGLVNGSRGVVLDLNNEQVTVRFLSGVVQTLCRKTWEVEDDKGKAQRRQMPFILAWSLTIHSIQGCTIDFAVCDCGASVFASGQAYVAISRVRDSKGLFLLEFVPKAIKTDMDALNYIKSLKDYDYIEEDDNSEEDSDDEESEEDEKIKHTEEELSVDILRLLNIGTKTAFKKWLIRNHPDKGGDTELCQRVVSAAEKRFGK